MGSHRRGGPGTSTPVADLLRREGGRSSRPNPVGRVVLAAAGLLAGASVVVAAVVAGGQAQRSPQQTPDTTPTPDGPGAPTAPSQPAAPPNSVGPSSPSADTARPAAPNPPATRIRGPQAAPVVPEEADAIAQVPRDVEAGAATPPEAVDPLIAPSTGEPGPQDWDGAAGGVESWTAPGWPSVDRLPSARTEQAAEHAESPDRAHRGQREAGRPQRADGCGRPAEESTRTREHHEHRR